MTTVLITLGTAILAALFYTKAIHVLVLIILEKLNGAF